MNFKDIKKFPGDGNYKINVPWQYIEKWIQEQEDEVALDLDPDFQRCHVWTREQQQKYVEFALRGGRGCNELRFNCAGWMGDFRGPFVLVDGKQRLTAVRKFLNDELDIFGGVTFSQFEGRPPARTDFVIFINDLNTREEVLNWYLDINSAGTQHTEAELQKVKNLLENENVIL